jgi:hypothetical protein
MADTMTDLQGRTVPIPEGSTLKPIDQGTDTMTDLQGNTVPIPKGTTLRALPTQGASAADKTKPEKLQRGSDQWYQQKLESALAPTTADVNPDSGVMRSQLIAPAKTLGREVYSAGKTALGMIPVAYHAFADVATPEEKAEQAQFEKEQGEEPGTESRGLKRIGLGLERMTTAPLIQGVKDWSDPATRPTLDQALSVAPEAVGQGAGTVVGGKLIEGAAEKVPAAVEGAMESAAPTSTLGRIALDEAKHYLIRKVPGGDIYTTAKRIGNRLSEAAEPLDATGENKAYAGEPAPKPSIGKIQEALAGPEPLTNKFTPQNVEGLLQKGLDTGPLKPDVTLKEQLTTAEPATPKAPRTQFEAANGNELDKAVSNEFSGETEAKAVQDRLHNLTNVELRQLAINLGEDLGQTTIGRAKQSGAIARPEMFKRLLENNSAKDIIQAVLDGKHLSPVTNKLIRSLGVDPQKVISELGSTEAALQSRLLRATQADLNRWK